MSSQPQNRQPNLFEMQCGPLQVTYSRGGFTGQSQFTYRDEDRDLSFQGEEIRTESTGIGLLVTVTLGFIPDLKSEEFSVLIPAFNLDEDNESRFAAVAIYTDQRTSKGGPKLVKGPLQIYTGILTLDGVARAVDF